MRAGYAYIWEYRVRPDSVGEFERTYGPEGTWADLFRQHDGYARTELHRDLHEPTRYVTIDYWRSEETCGAFRQAFASEFEALDKQCEALTDEETYLGEFSPVR
jgi:heme-degrading monooxygenase HmoA